MRFYNQVTRKGEITYLEMGGETDDITQATHHATLEGATKALKQFQAELDGAGCTCSIDDIDSDDLGCLCSEDSKAETKLWKNATVRTVDTGDHLAMMQYSEYELSLYG